jgi:DNA-directed RNA polymerase I subunit RPA1
LQAGLSNAAIRSNLIKQQTIEGPFGGAFEELIDAEDATKSPSNKESATNRNLKEHQKLQHQFTSQKDALSSQLLPSEVCFLHCQTCFVVCLWWLLLCHFGYIV